MTAILAHIVGTIYEAISSCALRERCLIYGLMLFIETIIPATAEKLKINPIS
jgi:hypothetical protein